MIVPVPSANWVPGSSKCQFGTDPVAATDRGPTRLPDDERTRLPPHKSLREVGEFFPRSGDDLKIRHLHVSLTVDVDPDHKPILIGVIRATASVEDAIGQAYRWWK